MATKSPIKSRKRRSDAWEIRANLNDVQLAQVFAWCRSLGYLKARALIESELKVDPPNLGNLAAWYESYSRLESEQRVQRAIVDGGAIRQLAEKFGDVSEAMTAALESEASAAILSGDPERIKLLVSLALKARGVRHEDEGLRLKARQFEEQQKRNAEARAALSGIGKAGGLDPETLAKIEEAAKLL